MKEKRLLPKEDLMNAFSDIFRATNIYGGESNTVFKKL
jgi:hypothetical protein